MWLLASAANWCAAGDANNLREMQRQHKGYEDDVAVGKMHLAKLRQRQTTDKIVIGLGFVFFLFVVLSIWHRRLLA